VVFRAADRALVDDVSLEIRAGEVVALVGPNGAGKSTLLGLLAGDLRPAAGGVLLHGEPVSALSARALALRRAVLPQQTLARFAFTVEEVVAMGRSPHVGPLSRLQARDLDAVRAAMAGAEVVELAERRFPTLSGGEAARAALARVLAQEAPVLLLDEPTAALDLRHQEMVMRLARKLARGARRSAVVVVLHDLNLASAWADRIGVMAGGRLVTCAPPWEALTADLVRRVFDHSVIVARHPARDCPLVVGSCTDGGAPAPPPKR